MPKTIPYSPSWVNRFTAWMRGLPTPASISYSTLFVLWSGTLGFLSRWIADLLPEEQWTLAVYYDVYSGPIFAVAVLAFYHYFEIEIAEALDQSKSLTNYSAQEREKKSYELINFPALPFFVASIIFASISIPGVLFEYGFKEVNLSNLLVFVEWGLTGAISFGFILRLIRFIVQIRRFYSDLGEISLFNLGGIYELPSIAARGGLLLLILWYMNVPFNLNDFTLGNPFTIFAIWFVSFVPLAAFALPFGALNRRLVFEKNQKINQVSMEIEEAFEKVREDFKGGKLSEMSNMEATISNLLANRNYLESIPTWPWKQGTFRLTMTAVLLPIFVWLVQQILDRTLRF